MRAALIDKPYSIVFTDVPEPEIMNEDEVKIQVKVTGICGSEIHAFHGTHPWRVPPVVSGHEFSGVVVQVGTEVRNFAVGDRVIVEPHIGCNQCENCRAGQYNICKSKKILGATYWSGSFGEYVVVPQRAILKLPDSVSFEQGALIEPIAVGMHAVRNNRLTSDMSCCIIGAGAIGLGLLISAKLAGCTKIYISDIKDDNLEAAQKIGCTIAINPNHEDLAQTINLETNGKGVDITFLAFGNRGAFENAFEITRPGGIVSQIALTGSSITMNNSLVQIKELHVVGSNMYLRDDFEILIDAMAKQLIKADHLISDILPIEQAAEAFEIIEKQTKPIIKILLKF